MMANIGAAPYQIDPRSAPVGLAAQQASPPIGRTGWVAALAMIVAGISGGCIMVIIPGILAALSRQHALSRQAAAFLASAEMAGLTIATLLVSLIIGRVNRRHLVAATLVVLIAAHALSFYTNDNSVLMLARLIAGLAEGVMIAVMTASVTGTAQPDRIFAVYMAANLATSTGLLLLLGRLVEMGQPQLIFLVLGAICMTALVLSPALPAFAPARALAPAGASPAAATVRRSALLGLGGTLVMFSGVGATWPLMGQYGISLGIAPWQVTQALSAAAAAGIVAGLIGSLLGDSLGRRLPLLAGSALLGATMLMLTQAHGVSAFTIGACCMMFLMVFIVPYYTGMMAALDAGGRMASLSMGMQFCGFTFGPLLAVPVLRHGFALLLAPASMLCVPAVMLMLSAERKARSLGLAA